MAFVRTGAKSVERTTAKERRIEMFLKLRIFTVFLSFKIVSFVEPISVDQ
jgi:hypothetical protein